MKYIDWILVVVLVTFLGVLLTGIPMAITTHAERMRQEQMQQETAEYINREVLSQTFTEAGAVR